MAKKFIVTLALNAEGNLEQVLDDSNKKLGKFGKKAAKVGKSLTKNLTAPIAGIAAVSVKTFADFEQGMSDVSTLIDTNTESIDDMGKEVLKIASRTPVAVEDLTGALFDVRSAGISASDQFKVLEKSAKLGVAGLGSTRQAADLVTSAISSFGLEGEEANKIYDTIFKTTKNGKTTIADLAPAFGDVAGNVSAAGVNVTEYFAAVSALTTTGQSASTAQRNLGQAIAGLTRDTKESREVFKALGAKDLDDLIQKSGGMVNAFRRISKSADGNKAKLGKLLGSQNALAAVIGLTDKVAEKFDETMIDMAGTADESEVAFEKQKTTLASSAQIMKNNLVGAGVEIGKVLAPALKDAAEFLGTLTEMFQLLEPETKRFIVLAGGIVAAIGPAIVIATKLATAITLVGEAISFTRVLMAAHPFGAVLVALGLLVTAVTLVIEEWEHFENFFALLWKNIKIAFDLAWKGIKGIIDDITGAVDRVIGARDKLVNLLVEDDNNPPLKRRNRRKKAANTAQAAGVAGLAGPPGPSGNTSIMVQFANMPPGTRTVLRNDGENEVAMRQGWQMQGAI